MPMIVCHHACIAVYDSPCLQKESEEKRYMCLIDNHKHASRSLTVDAYIWRL